MRSRACTSIRILSASQNRHAPDKPIRSFLSRTSNTLSRSASSPPRIITWSVGPCVKRTSAEPEISIASNGSVGMTCSCARCAHEGADKQANSSNAPQKIFFIANLP